MVLQIHPMYLSLPKFKVAYIGAIDDSPRGASEATKKYAENAIEALLAGRPVPDTKTKAMGCGIKWRDA
jgi:hypothetical protein